MEAHSRSTGKVPVPGADASFFISRLRLSQHAIQAAVERISVHSFEKYYDMAISRMLIVCCHSDNGQVALVDEVGRLEPETKAMMARWRDARGGSASDFSDNLFSASTCSECFDLIRESWWESISVDDAGDADVDLVHDRIAQLRDLVLRHAGRLISSPELWRFVPSPLMLLDNAPAWNTRFCLCARRLRVMSRLPVSMQSHVLERHTKRVQGLSLHAQGRSPQ